MDGQSVKTTERGGIRGFDAHKRVKGRKRHILVDTFGLLIACRGCKPKPQKIPRPLDHAYSPSPDDPSVPRVGWRPITVLTASQSFDRSNANQGTHLSDVIRGYLFPTRCYLLMSN